MDQSGRPHLEDELTPTAEAPSAEATPPVGATTSGPLAERLRRRIAEHGPITFAEFMDWALYDPEEGFYSHPPVGERGHFVTSPHVSPAFGALVCRQVEDFWELLGRPSPYDVVEVGAGDGTLARHILKAAPEVIRSALRYTAVERSPGARVALAGIQGVAVVATLAEVAREGRSGGLQGCVFANEVVDNLPFHRLWGGSEGPIELLVGLMGERFVVVNGPVSEEAARMASSLAFGEETNVRPAATELVDAAAGILQRGYVWLIDYGSASGSSPAHSYREQRVEAELLESPGSRDITAGVDFGALASHARTLGLAAWGPVTQREGLLALGFREWDARARDRQIELSAERRGFEAARAYSARSRASLLIDPTGLGAFLILALGVDMAASATPRFATSVDRPPPSPRPFPG